MRKRIALIFILISAVTAAAQNNSPIANIGARERISLDGYWKVIVDPYETGYYDYRRQAVDEKDSFFADKSYYADPKKLIEYDFANADSLNVPGDWNTQRDELFYYEGTVWYRKKVFITKANKRTFLHFGAANYEAVVGFNGHVVGKHTGGFTPFNFEVTDLVKEDDYNTIIVKVDNKRVPEGVPTVNSDWWNFGGLTRSVHIVRTPKTFIRDYNINLKKGSLRDIEGWIQLDGPSLKQNITISIPEIHFEKRIHADRSGRIHFTIDNLRNLKLWSPDNPKLYNVTISCKSDTVTDKIGFRSIETKGSKLLLNGKEIFCKGICLHEEEPFTPSGRATGVNDDKVLLSWVKELGCNFIRLAHYPHNEDMVRLADELGLMIWDEIPVYWTIHFDNPNTYDLAEQQLEEMISRDHNRASVVVWSVANETPRGMDRLNFIVDLIHKAKELDPTRLVTAAMETSYLDDYTITVNDELQDYTDLISFNTYIGWYDGTSDKCDLLSWKFKTDKPVFISEWGGGAKYGLHDDIDVRFSEEYQEYLYLKNTEMFDKIPGLVGTTPWILKDFRSPKRPLGGIQDNFNRKGLISENGEKKSAFFVLKNWYSKK